MKVVYPSIKVRRTRYKRIGQPETLHFPALLSPDSESSVDCDHFNQRTIVTKTPFVTIIRNGRVCGNHSFVFTPSYKLVQDLSFHFDGSHLHPISKVQAIQNYKSNSSRIYSKNVAVLTFCSSNNYFHWLFDVLPRLKLLRRSGFRIDKYFMNCDRTAPYQAETLGILGIPPSKIINNKSNIQAKQLIVPSMVNDYFINPDTYVRPHYIANWVCKYLRSTFMSPAQLIQKLKDKLIYISRENAAYRRVVNEDEVIQFLSAYGFQKYHLETMTISEQVELFSRAKVVIAPHGAGLANLVFCNPGTKVVEIFSTIYIPEYYWMISTYNQLEYYYLINSMHDHVPILDIQVDINRLKELIQKAGILPLEGH